MDAEADHPNPLVREPPPHIPSEPAQQANPDPIAPQAPTDAAPPPGVGAPLDAYREANRELLASLTQAFLAAVGTAHEGTRAPDERIPVRDPDVFNGTKPHTLRLFLGQSQTVFEAKPRAFATDKAKILYVASRFEGDVAEWWRSETAYPADPPPDYTTDYEAFALTLEARYGSPDPEGEARDRLDRLRMADNSRIQKYLTPFYAFSRQTRFDNYALRHAFYKGLPDRIKDELIRHSQEELNTLDGLQRHAQAIDNHYWRREEERRRTVESRAHSSKPSGPAHQKRPAPGGSSRPNFNDRRNSPPRSPPPQRRPSSSPLASVLGPDGRLTQKEREHRIRENLCLVCAKPGHVARDCPARKDKKAPKTRARAAEASEAEEDSESAEPVLDSGN